MRPLDGVLDLRHSRVQRPDPPGVTSVRSNLGASRRAICEPQNLACVPAADRDDGTETMPRLVLEND